MGTRKYTVGLRRAYAARQNGDSAPRCSVTRLQDCLNALMFILSVRTCWTGYADRCVRSMDLHYVNPLTHYKTLSPAEYYGHATARCSRARNCALAIVSTCTSDLVQGYAVHVSWRALEGRRRGVRALASSRLMHTGVHIGAYTGWGCSYIVG